MPARSATVASLAAAAVLIASTTAEAATIRVQTTADQFGTGAACSLREAVNAANLDAPFGGCAAGTGNDEIVVPKGSFALTRPGVGENLDLSGDLDVTTQSLSIVHHGTRAAEIDARGIDRVLDVLPGAFLVKVSGLTLRGGTLPNGSGGGISNISAALVLRNSTLLANRANGVGTGGGLYSCCGATSTLENVTIARNRAGADGGGFYNCCGATDFLNNVTISDNVADFDAGAPSAGNGGGIADCCGGQVTIWNTILAGNRDASSGGAHAPECFPDTSSGGSLLSRGFNLLGNTAKCAIAKERGDRFGRKPRLRAPAQNGGAVKTMALRRDSPALNAGSHGGEFACLGADARGVARPQGRRCDIGSYELKSRRR